MSKSYSNIPRPFKVWSADRQKRKSITASNLNEFKIRAAEKLGYENYYHLRVVLEQDGTEVEDDSYFQSAENDTVFLLLRDNENWSPPGMDALKSALSAIPQIVCDTINSLKLANKSPAWSIKDDQGYITVTLQWEHDDKLKYLSDYEEPSWKLSSQQLQQQQQSQQHPPQFRHHQPPTMPPSYSAQYGDKIYSSTFPRPSSSRTKSYEMYLRGLRNLGFGPHDPGSWTQTLPFNKTLSADDFSSMIIDRPIDADLSSAIDLTSYCDFHCSSLHRDGGSIKVSKSVGTSPIMDFNRIISPISTTTQTTTAITTARMTTGHTITSATTMPTTGTTMASMAKAQSQQQQQQYDDDQIRQIAQTTSSGGTTSLQKVKKGHVRFMDLEKEMDRMDKRNISLMELINGHSFDGGGRLGGAGVGIGGGSMIEATAAEGSETESETETTERDDEQLCERYLLLVDQLHANHKKHLSIKDIGIILERLKTKIIDIDKLERDKESIDCYNWLIKAIIKGDMLREIGVVYNGQYYSLMEHPGYF